MEYSTLSAEDQKNLTDQTIREIEANHFSNKLALKEQKLQDEKERQRFLEAVFQS